jgi:hypothetical protein
MGHVLGAPSCDTRALAHLAVSTVESGKHPTETREHASASDGCFAGLLLERLPRLPLKGSIPFLFMRCNGA